MTKKIGFFALLFVLSQSTVAQDLTSLAEPAAIHQLFKACKKNQAYYTCHLSGKTILAILQQTHNIFVTADIEENSNYDLYWWPNACTPEEKFTVPNRCTFHLLLQKKHPTAILHRNHPR